jgi:sugar phosphate isomerase/epimerase
VPIALSLHQLTALDASPLELVAIAGELEVEFVCLFTHVPDAAAGRYPFVDRANVDSLRAALDEYGVRLGNVEVFPLDRSGPRDEFEPALAIGAQLGATRATAHVHNIASDQEASDRFAAFAAQAASHGLIAGLEFNNFSAVTDLGEAARIVRAAGVGSVVLDTLHLVRSGGTASDVARAAELIDYAQLSDGPAFMPGKERWREAVAERLTPGEGDFPLAALIAPLAYGTLFEVEVPQSAARKAGVPALDRCLRAVAASRALLARHRQDSAP